MTPWVAFTIGAVLSNLFQWAKSVSIQTKLRGRERWLGYWYVGLPHMIMNVVVDTLVCVAWRAEWLDDIVALIPGGPENVGVPYTPQVGIMLGAGVDIFGDQITYTLRKVLGSRVPFLRTTQDTAPTAPEGAEGDR